MLSEKAVFSFLPREECNACGRKKDIRIGKEKEEKIRIPMITAARISIFHLCMYAT